MRTLFSALALTLFVVVEGISADAPEKQSIKSKHRILEKFTEAEKDDNPRNRIIGGSNAPYGEYPWYAASNTLNCGGTQVTNKHILTAAHCSGSFTYNQAITIGLACTYTGNCGQSSHSSTVQKFTPHPEYNTFFLTRDFAIVTLNTPTTRAPAQMDLTGMSKHFTRDKKLWTAGFGQTSDGPSGSTPSYLKHLEVNYVPHRVCKVPYRFIDSSTMCAANPGLTWEDACRSDSGGPLYDKENNLLVGVVSFGDGCAKKGFPGVYSRIADEADWIRDTICSDYTAAEYGYPAFCNEFIRPVPAPAPTPTPPQCRSTETEVEVELVTDYYANENSVTVAESNTGRVIDEWSFTTLDGLQLKSLRTCVQPRRGRACVNVTVSDSAGDGIYIPGGWSLRMDNEEITWSYSNEDWSSTSGVYCSTSSSTILTGPSRLVLILVPALFFGASLF